MISPSQYPYAVKSHRPYAAKLKCLKEGLSGILRNLVWQLCICKNLLIGFSFWLQVVFFFFWARQPSPTNTNTDINPTGERREKYDNVFYSKWKSHNFIWQGRCTRHGGQGQRLNNEGLAPEETTGVGKAASTVDPAPRGKISHVSGAPALISSVLLPL